MAEYIEREKLYNNLILLAKYETGERQQGILGCAETVRIVSAADVAPVVRCKDCLFWEFGENECESWEWCKILHCNMPLHAFCNFGVRKDEAE